MVHGSRLKGVLAAVLVAGLCAAVDAAALEGLTSTLSTEQAWLTTSDDVFVRVSLTNESRDSLFVVRWQTPLEGIEANLFEVARNGEPVEYVGKTFKRGAPTADDYLELRAGETRTALVELSAVYDMARPGEYTVQFRGYVQDALSVAGLDSISAPAMVDSNLVVLWRDGEDKGAVGFDAATLREYAGLERQTAEALAPAYVSCSSTRQSSLVSALSNAESIALNGRNYLNAGTRGARYTTWFGTYKSSRYNSVRSHFQSIHSALSGQQMTFHCDCTSSAYAYVYPNQPYHIWLCNAFWNAPMTGTDSKSGTLVHEVSHFNAVASTDDWAYGQSACKSLATSNPNRAVDNADSHEYFAENTPAQN